MKRVGLTATLTTLTVASVLAQRGPAPAPTALPPDVIALACAPSAITSAPSHSLRVTGGQAPVERRNFAPGDLVTINAGTDHGIEVGQEFFARRVQSERGQTPSLATPAAVRTSGWLKVYAVDDELSLATVSHACDTIRPDDYLEPFAAPVVPAAHAVVAPAQKSNYARILFGADRRKAFAQGDFVVIDHGSDHGISAGARFVVYHDRKLSENFLYEAGEAVALTVKADSATLKVTRASSALLAGDYVALRK